VCARVGSAKAEGMLCMSAPGRQEIVRYACPLLEGRGKKHPCSSCFAVASFMEPGSSSPEKPLVSFKKSRNLGSRLVRAGA